METGTLDFSVVLPVYGEAEALSEIYERFNQCIAGKHSYEIIFINDGNIRNEVFGAVEAMRGLKNTQVIHLSRNFGQHIAIAAGLKNANGKHILVMDADLQYLPEDAYEMYLWAAKNKHSAVLSVLKKREHSLRKRMASKIFYYVMRKLGAPQRNDIGSMFLVSRHAAKGILRINDRYRLTIPMIYWLYGDIAYFEVSHQARNFGQSGYNLLRSLKLTLNGVTSFSSKPLYFPFVLSIGFATTAIGIMVNLLIERWVFGRTFFSGWMSTLFAILISATLILVCLGVVGIYVGRVFETTNRRPLYFVQENDRDIFLFEDEGI